jgi:hypothetical protein
MHLKQVGRKSDAPLVPAIPTGAWAWMGRGTRTHLIASEPAARSAILPAVASKFGPRSQIVGSESKAAVTVRVVVGNWPGLGATVDACILKLLIEEQLGWPTELIPNAGLFAEEGL